MSLEVLVGLFMGLVLANQAKLIEMNKNSHAFIHNHSPNIAQTNTNFYWQESLKMCIFIS